jgi:hypothetical protein
MSSPPLLAQLILAELTPDQLCDDVLGDLAEEYQTRREVAGASAAARWYWGAAISSALPLALACLRRARAAVWGWGLAGVVAGFGALMALYVSGDLATRHLGQLLGARLQPWTSMLASVAFGAACATGAGWIAGSIGRRARLASAAALALLFLGLNLSAVVRGTWQGPLWYWVAFGVAAGIGAVAGGVLRLWFPARL